MFSTMDWPDWMEFIRSNPASVYAVMAVGILAGAIVKSITGFGSTIAHLCIYSILRSTLPASVAVGTLQQAIMSEVAFRTVTAWPYLIMTDARNTSNAKLAVSISLFQALGAPVGAWLLMVLDQKRLELSLAGALFVVLLVQGLSAWLIPAQPTGEESAATSQVEGNDSTPRLTDGSAQAGSTKPRKAAVSNVSTGQGDVHEPLLLSPTDQSVLRDVPRDSVNRLWQAPTSAASETAQQAEGHSQRQWHQVVTVTGAQKAAGNAAADTDSEGLLHSPSSSDADPEQALGSSQKSSTGGCWGTCSTQQEAREWAVLLGIGSLAGSLSGVMGGLTGIDGPPTILMFKMLKTSKATVRGTNAVINVFLMIELLINYGITGVFRASDIPLYALSSAVGMLGTWWGDILAKRMSQGAFHIMLNLMVVTCGVLMLASGLGLVPDQDPA